MLVVSFVIYVLCSLKKIAAISKKNERKKKMYQKNEMYEVTVYLQSNAPLG